MPQASRLTAAERLRQRSDQAAVRAAAELAQMRPAEEARRKQPGQDADPAREVPSKRERGHSLEDRTR